MSNTINELSSRTNVCAQHLNCLTPDLRAFVIREFNKYDSEHSIKTSLTLCVLQIGLCLVVCVYLDILSVT